MSLSLDVIKIKAFLINPKDSGPPANWKKNGLIINNKIGIIFSYFKTLHLISGLCTRSHAIEQMP